ncbi:hypothetical protein ASPZODRAFT_98770 [Penicilliopsis zonata CBS 506.65]|uniref:Zn(2)-C6 fungal-type domain-containing protein n=1 Tax=Penicilliopsis zonata CBS 506.65 TaxID=1073090 RepID=A0A1L9SF31_9EURO|nr:hypothetical protein ASPZODRAFT_98770 [Penicilliopsis zonata CBS 506.65]OJJ45830.1 hypothetical protein ASPZODRAFT_98770 [Penicilliopsis zonata CBS 506.65]
MQQPNACIRCASRKVRCDRHEPCRTCARSGLECVYRVVPPRQRREDALSTKLRRYEELLREAGVNIDSDSITGTRGIDDPNDQGRDGDGENESGGLVEEESGKKYYENNLLLEFGQKVIPFIYLSILFLAGYNRSQTGEDLPSQLLLGSSPVPTAISIDASMAKTLWTVFCENVNPLIKIIHVPTGSSLLEEVLAGDTPVRPARDALFYSIYACAVMSMAEDECAALFHRERGAVLDEMMAAAKRALLEASFMQSLELMVLQAFVLFLTALQTCTESSAFWSLLGVAIRRAQTLGLHRDGTRLGLSLFETEMRRRLWWYLVSLDVRATEVAGAGAGSSILSQPWDTQVPLNVDDDSLHLGMTGEDFPESRSGLTEMSFVLFRCETVRFLRLAENRSLPLGGAPPRRGAQIALLGDRIADFENRLEERFLRFCDPVVPLHALLNVTARATVAKLQRIAAMFRSDQQQQQRQQASNDHRAENLEQTYAFGVRMLEYDHLVLSNRATQRFGWYTRTQFAWGAAIGLLEWLRLSTKKDPGADVAVWGPCEESAWQHIEQLYDHHPEYLQPQQHSALPRTVNNLAVRVWNGGPQRWPPPAFIEAIKSVGSRCSTGEGNENNLAFLSDSAQLWDGNFSWDIDTWI